MARDADANGSFSYTPGANYNGATASLTSYDGTLDSNVATVSLTVTSITETDDLGHH